MGQETPNERTKQALVPDVGGLSVADLEAEEGGDDPGARAKRLRRDLEENPNPRRLLRDDRQKSIRFGPRLGDEPLRNLTLEHQSQL